MQVPFLGVGVVTALRIAMMLIFIAVFVGILVWLLLPRGRRESRAQGILHDDDARPEDRP